MEKELLLLERPWAAPHPNTWAGRGLRLYFGAITNFVLQRLHRTAIRICSMQLSNGFWARRHRRQHWGCCRSLRRRSTQLRELGYSSSATIHKPLCDFVNGSGGSGRSISTSRQRRIWACNNRADSVKHRMAAPCFQNFQCARFIIRNSDILTTRSANLINGNNTQQTRIVNKS